MQANHDLAQNLLDAVLAQSDVRASMQAALAALPSAPALVLGGGKAARVMAETAATAFPDTPGVLAVPSAHTGRIGQIELVPAGHPLPDSGSVLAVSRQEELLRRVDGSCLFLLSGGASAMLGAPAGNLPLDRLEKLYAALLQSGFEIHVMNLIRRHLTRWGGGKFLRMAGNRPLTALAVSDVLDDDLSVIGSGPTVADPSTCVEAAFQLGKLHCDFSDLSYWLEKSCEETLKPGDPLLESSATQVILSNRTVVDGVARKMQAQVLAPQTGDVGAVASMWSQVLAGKPGVYIAGGEPTVRIPAAAPGRGGRNQHLVMEIARRKPQGDWLFASMATDGMDGNSGNAGAWVDSALAKAASPVDLSHALAVFDSAGWCERQGLAFKTGPTGTNVADVQVAIVKNSSGAIAGTGEPR